MKFLSLLGPYRWAVYALLAAALVAAAGLFVSHQRGIGEERAAARYELSIGKQKVEAAHKLADALIDVVAAQLALQDFKNTQEVKDAKHKERVSSLSGQLLAAAGPVGRLRDPNQETGCRGCRDDTEGEAAATAPSATTSAQELYGKSCPASIRGVRSNF